MELEIYSTKALEVKKVVDYINLPAVGGSVGVLKNHAPMLLLLKEGKIIFKEKAKEFEYEIKSFAVAEVLPHRTRIFLQNSK